MKIKAMVKHPHSDAELISIEPSFENLYEMVNGYIELVKLDDGIAVIMNDSARLNEEESNCICNEKEYFGTLIFVGIKNSEFADIPKTIELISIPAINCLMVQT